MRCVIEAKSDTLGGRKVWLSPGQALVVGRTEAADLTFPHDREMSATHFRLSCEPGRCHVRDLASPNGTFLNGARIEHSPLRAGDTLVAGATTFVVIATGPEPEARAASPAPATSEIPAAAARIGHWRLEALPIAWRVRDSALHMIEASSRIGVVKFNEHPLARGESLADYVRTVTRRTAAAVEGTIDKGPDAVAIRGADEALEVVLRSPGPIQWVQHCLYARHDTLLGRAMLTVPRTAYANVESHLGQLARSLEFQRRPGASPPAGPPASRPAPSPPHPNLQEPSSC